MMDIQKTIQTLKGENELMLFNPSTGEVGNKYRLTDLDRDFYEAHEFCVKMLKELEQYRQIGTVDECKAAREKMKPKKAVEDTSETAMYCRVYICPSCGKKFTGGSISNNCYHCGQALDWAESESD